MTSTSEVQTGRLRQRGLFGNFWAFARQMVTDVKERRAASRAHIAKLEAMGICTMCGEYPAQDDDSFCLSCRGNHSAAP